MRHLLSLVLTASFLFLSSGAQGSNLPNNDDDNGSVSPAIVMMHVTPTVTAASSASSTSDDLQCYRITLGKKQPLFDEAGKLLDQRIPVREPAVPSALTLSSSQPREGVDVPALAPDQPDTRSLIQKTRQDGNITALDFLAQTILLEWMSAVPVERHLLLQTCRYYRAFAMPILGETHFISLSLRKDLLISIIAGQTGDVELFFRDQRTTFEQCSILELKDAIASGYYNGVLSQKTEHGQTYRSIGPESVRDVLGDKGFSFRGKDLRLVPLNFSGAERMTNLDLSQNQLKALDLSKQTALHILFLYNNQLKALDLSKQTALRNLSLSKNQLKALDLSQQTALENLFLYNNHLEALNLSQQPMLTWLDLSHNQLKELDLSQLMALVSLNLSDNQLKELDLSKQTALERLDLSKNQLTTLSGLGWMRDFRALALALDLDAELLRRDQNLLTTLIDLNAQRNEYFKIYLQAWSKDANGAMSYKRINLD